jgi:hypothetical protein
MNNTKSNNNLNFIQHLNDKFSNYDHSRTISKVYNFDKFIKENQFTVKLNVLKNLQNATFFEEEKKGEFKYKFKFTQPQTKKVFKKFETFVKIDKIRLNNKSVKFKDFSKANNNIDRKSNFIFHELTTIKITDDIITKIIIKALNDFKNIDRIDFIRPECCKTVNFSEICFNQFFILKDKIDLKKKININQSITDIIEFNKQPPIISNNKNLDLMRYNNEYGLMKYSLNLNKISKICKIEEFSQINFNGNGKPKFKEISNKQDSSSVFHLSDNRNELFKNFVELPWEHRISFNSEKKQLKAVEKNNNLNFIHTDTINNIHFLENLTNSKFNPIIGLNSKNAHINILKRSDFAVGQGQGQTNNNFIPLPKVSFKKGQNINKSIIDNSNVKSSKLGEKRRFSEIVNTNAKTDDDLMNLLIINSQTLKNKINLYIIQNLCEDLKKHKIYIFKSDINDQVDFILDINSAAIMINGILYEDEYDIENFEKLCEIINSSFLKYKNFIFIIYFDNNNNISQKNVKQADVTKNLKDLLASQMRIFNHIQKFVISKFQNIQTMLNLKFVFHKANNFLNISECLISHHNNSNDTKCEINPKFLRPNHIKFILSTTEFMIKVCIDLKI